MDTARPLWLVQRTGVTHPELPVLFHKGEPFGQRGPSEILDVLPKIFPQECRDTLLLEPPLHAPADIVGLKAMFMNTIAESLSRDSDNVSTMGTRVGDVFRSGLQPFEEALHRVGDINGYLSGRNVPCAADFALASYLHDAMATCKILGWKGLRGGTAVDLDSEVRALSTQFPLLAKWFTHMVPRLSVVSTLGHRYFLLVCQHAHEMLTKTFHITWPCNPIVLCSRRQAAESLVRALGRPTDRDSGGSRIPHRDGSLLQSEIQISGHTSLASPLLRDQQRQKDTAGAGKNRKTQEQQVPVKDKDVAAAGVKPGRTSSSLSSSSLNDGIRSRPRRSKRSSAPGTLTNASFCF